MNTDIIEDAPTDLTEYVERRVRRGIEWLETQNPGWMYHIDLDRLWLGTMTWCVLGQVIGEDEYDILYECEGGDWLRDHGFDKHHESYEMLTNTWKDMIEPLIEN